MKSYEEHEAFYEKHGVRYSELLRLPYWDSIRWVVVDPMHEVYLNVCAQHDKDFLGMSLSMEDGDGSLPTPSKGGPDPKMIENAWLHLRSSPLKDLKSLHLPVLQALASRAALRTKKDMKAALLDALKRFVHQTMSLIL